ncbi:MAG: hypothetical protein IK078_00910 [Lachnospiraceae bacterium]|nr:hypothetical protein [Lachnospiraceae bacterium]
MLKNKNLINCIAFLLILTLSLSVVSRVLAFKYDDGILQMEQFYRQPRGSVDLLVLGSSHAFVDIDPTQIEEQTGLRTYDLGASMQSIWHTYYDLEEALKYQSPKLIILDVFRMTETFDYSKESKLIKSVYGMRPSLTKLRAIQAGFSDTAPVAEVLTHFFEFPSYHSRYAELTTADLAFWTRPPKDYKGHYSLSESNPQQRPDLSDVTEKTPVEEKTAAYFLKILDTAKEKNIPVILVNVPYVVSADDQKIYRSMEDLIALYSADGQVTYLDLNQKVDEIGIDFETDFADAEHLNEKGTEKLNRYLADYLIKAGYNK